MTYNRICISSGHSDLCQGAVGILNEVQEAKRVTARLADELRDRGIQVEAFSDLTSTSQQQNLERIVGWHNGKQRDLDIAVHFNSFDGHAHGTEVWYVTQHDLAAEVSAAIASCGFTDRGAKKTSDLYFLNHTEMPAILLEICFVDSQSDAELYMDDFDGICDEIATALAGDDEEERPPLEPPAALFQVSGLASTFGGPLDTGVAPDEGLALYSAIDQAPQLFLPFQPAGTTGLARRLNPFVNYVAARWDYSVTPKTMLAERRCLVRARDTGKTLLACCADWGPAEHTGRALDLSPACMEGLFGSASATDAGVVELIFPAP